MFTGKLAAALVGLVAILGLMAADAHAQQQSAPPIPVFSYVQTAVGTDSLAVTTTSSRTAMSSTSSPQVWITNKGQAPACVKLGNGSVTATLPCPAGFLIGAGQTFVYGIGGSVDVAAITASGSTTLGIIEGYGAPSTGSGGGGGGGGTVTTTPNGGQVGVLAVGGDGAIGTALTVNENPILVGGSDYGGTPAKRVMKVDAAGLAYINCANCSGSGVSAADEATFIAGTSLFAPSGGFFQTTATSNPLTNGQQGFVQMTAQRAFFVNLRNASGTELAVAANPLQVSLANTAANATAIKVDGSAVTQPISAASLPLPTGAMGATGGTVGLVAGSAKVGIVTTDQTTPGTTDLVHAAQQGSWAVTATTNAESNAGPSTAPSKQLFVAGRAQNAEPTAGTNGQSVPTAHDLLGRTITSPYANKEIWVRGANSSTGTGATAFTGMGAAGASVKNYVTALQCANSSGTAASITLNDTSAWTGMVPAGGGNNVVFPVPLVTANNTGLTFTSSAGVTTMYCSAQGYTGT